jgi:hypothetical protein
MPPLGGPEWRFDDTRPKLARVFGTHTTRVVGLLESTVGRTSVVWRVAAARHAIG